MQKIDLLLVLAEKSKLFNQIEITTTNLAKQFNVSQQTISNALKNLENEELINRKPSYSGITISLEKNGLQQLSNYKDRLNKLTTKNRLIKGKIFSGIGDGKFYTQLPDYKKQFIKLLNIKPYPGTLNIKCIEEEKNRFLFEKIPIKINGFKTKKRSYGCINCYPIKINKINGAIIIPKRTIHGQSIVEIISEQNLRSKLNLKDNDMVTII